MTDEPSLTDAQIGELARKVASFARAHVKLLLEVGGPLQNVECYLNEDGHSAMLYVPHDDHWATASFELAEQTTEDEFDAARYIEMLERSHG